MDEDIDMHLEVDMDIAVEVLVVNMGCGSYSLGPIGAPRLLYYTFLPLIYCISLNQLLQHCDVDTGRGLASAT